MKKRIYVPDIECDSCSRLINKKFKSVQGIENVTIKDDYLDVDYDESLIKAENLVTTVKNAGFRASFEPFDRKSLKERIRDFKENTHKYKIELQGFMYSIYVFLILTALEGIAYFGFFSSIPNFFAKYGVWLLYLNITVATVGFAIWHFSAYKTKVTCMTGMMIGMTVGMQAGMMLGAIIGATNGFFTGSMAGMIIGVIVGAITGKCCGVMGVMEGMMAGLMGGTMGPMVSVMMFSDHLNIFMPFYMIVNVLILWGFSYMVFEELVENSSNVKKSPIDFVTFASICILVTIGLILLIMYGPKSILVSF